jgi:hypothetical protein
MALPKYPILKGAKPGDIPIFRANLLTINLKAVKAHGVKMPPELPAVVDEVIE